VGLGLDLPCLLVGHSLGGLHVRVAASLYPALVSGLVLVDPSHEDMLDDEHNRKAADRVAGIVALLVKTAPLGTPRFLGPLYARTVSGQLRRTLGDDERSLMDLSTRLTMCSAGGLRAIAAELVGVPAALASVRTVTAAHPLPSVPLTVISAAAAPRTPAEGTARQTIDRLHAQLAGASPLGRHVLATNSGHLVPVDEPALVARCIRETIEAAAVRP
jgi:pimeloyl-ACP methyl ester carboxylesterase